MRIGESELDLLRELAELMVGELSKHLEGKISDLDTENRHLEGVILRVTIKLHIYRDQNLTSFSEDNRGLKEEIARLKKVEGANQKVAEQKRQLKRLLVEEKELQESRLRVEEAEEREQELKARLENLSKAADDHLEQLAGGSKGGFDQAVQIACILEPDIDFKYFDGRYEARDGKIYEGERVAYDPKVDGESEEDEQDQPEVQADVAGTAATLEAVGDGNLCNSFHFFE